MGTGAEFSFDSAGLSVDEVARHTADMWADLPFDRDGLSALKRDGLALDGLNLGGHCPYRISVADNGQLRVGATGEQADALLDLWRMHFLRGLRPRTLAA